MYGKIFESMYTGSMRGAGSLVFAVWGYVIASMKPDKVVGAQVELRPDLLGFYIGEEPGDIQRAIDFLCEPDPNSTCPDEGGRRLVAIGKFVYRVVSGARYMAMRNQEERREYQRVKQQEYRDKKKGRRTVRAENEGRERRYMKKLEEGDVAGAEAVAAEGKAGAQG